MKLRMKVKYSVLMILICTSLNGQIYSIQDTIKINEVIITTNKTTADMQGYKSISIDSSILFNYSHETLADLLTGTSDIFVKSYGMGGSATPSFRGTGAGHTQLQWNNININSPMLGQPDLSLVPAGLIDEVDIFYGGASMPFGAGGIGGMINLENKPEWNKKTIVSLNPGAGSFGQYSGLVKIKTGSLNFQSVTKAYLQYAKNNFGYINDVSSSDPVWEVMKNSESLQKGFMHELYYRKSKNILSARIWYQSADRNLPSSMLIPQSGNNEKQVDESVRTMVNYDGFVKRAEYFFTGSFLVSKLDYSNSLASIDSRNQSESFIFKTGLVNRPGESILTKVILDNEHTVVRSENYNETMNSRNIATMTAMAEFNNNGRVAANFLVREILNEDSFMTPDLSAGMQYKISDGSDYYLKANYSRNSKFPSMNDLFWIPGGNPDLLNETANMIELIYEMDQKISSPLDLKFNLSVYHNSIRNMIQWRPGNYAYWTADNVKSINTSGIETSASFIYIINKVSSVLNLSYAYTSAITTGSDIPNDESTGKQLIYVPENQANASLRINYLDFYALLISDYSGKRYTTSDNSELLPGYLLNSITTGYSFHHKSNMYNLNLSVENIFNISYETISYFPQPGRSYSLKLLIQLSK